MNSKIPATAKAPSPIPPKKRSATWAPIGPIALLAAESRPALLGSKSTGLKVNIPLAALPVIGGDVIANPLGLYPADGFPSGSNIIAVFPAGIDPAVLTRHYDTPEKSLDPTQTTTLILRASDNAIVMLKAIYT